MNIISIDFAKYSTGIYTKVEGQESCFIIANKKKCSDQEALLNLYTAFTGILQNVRYNFGLIEGYGFNPINKQSMIIMSEIGGVIKLAFAYAEVPLITMPIQTWKMLTIGRIEKHGNETVYLDAIKSKYERSFANIDIADAFLIYQAAKVICKRTKRLTPAMGKIKAQLQKIIEVKKGVQK